MKQKLICAVVAAGVSLAALWLDDEIGGRGVEPESGGGTSADLNAQRANPVFTFTDALIEDTWVNAGRTAGSDLRTLTDASTSICYLTKIEISRVQGPEDSNSCAIEIDDFTGFWQLIATVDEGGRSEVRCNARCLTWETNGLDQ